MHGVCVEGYYVLRGSLRCVLSGRIKCSVNFKVPTHRYLAGSCYAVDSDEADFYRLAPRHSGAVFALRCGKRQCYKVGALVQNTEVELAAPIRRARRGASTGIPAEFDINTLKRGAWAGCKSSWGAESH